MSENAIQPEPTLRAEAPSPPAALRCLSALRARLAVVRVVARIDLSGGAAAS